MAAQDSGSARTTVLIYGAYGYTGRLCCEEAARKELDFIVGGRNAKKVADIASAYGVKTLVFDSVNAQEALTSPEAAGVGVILNCAGPFVETFAHIARACCKAGVHYVDVTGEIEVFQDAAAMNDAAKAAGIMIMPGVGFDIVATDCMAAALAADLPSATHLRMAFTSVGSGGASRGTATTMVKALSSGAGAVVREEGALRTLPIGDFTTAVDFGHGGAEADPGMPSEGVAEARLASFPREVLVTRWGDAVTAFHTTGIKNISVFLHLPQPAATIAWFLTSPYGRCLCGAAPLESILTPLMVPEGGPGPEQLAKGRTMVWGEVRDAATGATVTRRLHIAPGYAFTAKAAVLSCEYILFRLPRRLMGAGARPRKGFFTPATAFGADFATQADPTAVMFAPQAGTKAE